MESKDPCGRHQERNNQGKRRFSSWAMWWASGKMADFFYTHITNFVAQRQSLITRGYQFLEPWGYLNIEITDKQCYLLQPTAADVFVGNILEDRLGQDAIKKIPS
jgi:hypothetical protein